MERRRRLFRGAGHGESLGVTQGSTRSSTTRISGARAQHGPLVSRRAFLAGSAAIVAGGAATALVGCDEHQPANEVAGTSASPASNFATLPAGSTGGTLRIYNFDAAPYDSLDPHLTQFGPIANTHSAIFSRLLRYDDEVAGTIVPDLVEAMPEQPDDLTYVFRVRDGVRFHDTPALRAAFQATAGRLLTADDVRLSIERQRNKASPQAQRFFRRSVWETIDKVEVPDARTLIIHMQRPVAPVLSFFAGRHAFVLPHEVIDRADDITSGQALIGTGPFMLDSFEERVAVRLRRNPTWFAGNDIPVAGSGRPFIDGYDAFFSPQEDQFQRAALDRRIVDITGFVDQTELGRAHKTNLADINLEQIDSGSVLAARLLIDRPPFRDDRARRAIHLALDRSQLIDLLYPALDGEPSARPSGPIAPGATRWAVPADDLMARPGYRSEETSRADDLREAKQLWDAALGTEPMDLRIVFAGLPRVIPDRAVQAVRAQLQGALGANVITQVDLSGQALLASAYQRNLDGATEGAVTFSVGFEDGGVDLDDWLFPHYRSGEAMNTYRLQDAQLDALLDRQRAEFDESTRRKIGLDAQEYLIANVNARIDICAPVERRLVWGYVRNSRMPLSNASPQDLANVWLDASHPAFAARLPSL
jgi:peptide/nickel transport system substrate-binding protein